MNLGKCSITMAELWGDNLGLQLAFNLGMRCRTMLLKMDSNCAIQLMSNDDGDGHSSHTLIHAIKALSDKDWEVILQHTYCEAN